MNITIRDVNPRIWKEIKIEAVRGGLTLGQTINMALEEWLNEYRKKSARKKIKGFWDLKPLDLEIKDASELSLNVDKVLYGEQIGHNS